jgi:sortase A
MRVVIATHGGYGEATQAALRAAFYVFFALGIAALGYAGYAELDLFWFQHIELAKIEAVPIIPQPPAAEPASIVAPLAVGEVIGEIEVPRLNLKAAVVEGDSERLLRRSVGHLPDTAMPGQAGNVALAGHRDGLFRPLRNVLPGDLITFRTHDRQFEYQVEWTAIVPPSATQVIQPTSEPVLTLVTCYPFYYVGAAPQRFIVRARSLAASDPAAPAPAGVGTSTQAVSDTSASR